MDLDQSFSDLSLDMSDADPTELLDKINDIDELDAELFGPPKVPKPSQKSSEVRVKKTVSFQDPINSMSEKKKREKSDDWLFADDGDSSGLLGDNDVTATKNGHDEEKLRVRSSIKSLMTPNTANDILKKSAVTMKKMTLSDFPSIDGDKVYPEMPTSPYSAKSAKSNRKSINLDDEFGFGSYRPTLSTPSDSKKAASRLQSAGSGTDSGQFPNVENFPTLHHQDHTVSQQPIPPVGQKDKELPPTSASDTPSSLSSSGFSGHKLKLNVLVNDQMHASPKVESKAMELPHDSLTAEAGPALLIPSMPPPNSEGNLQRRLRAPEVAFAESAISPNAVPLKVASMTKAHDVSSLSLSVPQRSIELKADSMDEVNQKMNVGLPSQSANTFLHDIGHSYKRDLELLKSSYSAQLELLRSSYHDLKLRAERDMDSVRESYSVRIDVLRSSMQAQIQAESAKECDHQDEIKRLRSLHLQAWEESRMDMDAKYNRLREVHAEEIKSLKHSSHHQRNIESMMAKVDDSTEKLQLLSAKYESAYNAMTRESETIALSNKQLVAVVQNQLAQQQRSTSDVHMQVQQTVSRLEGMISGMNRKFEEQHYAIQTSHGILQSAHAALQEERKQFMQQITLEREHLRRAHRELITVQSEFQQNVREDHTKLLLEAKNLSTAAERHEEVVSTAAEQMAKRNQEYEKATAVLNSERIECIKQHAKLEAKSEKLNSRKEYLDEEIKKFKEEKVVLQQIQSELEYKQHEINAISQKKKENEEDMGKVHDESRRFERERNEKLAGIHVQMKELANQRQLLTEERQALAKERMAGSSLYPQAEIEQPVTPVKQRMIMSHPGSPDLGANSGLLLWQHAAKKDRSFLEDEQFFLKTVGNSPYGKKYL